MMMVMEVKVVAAGRKEGARIRTWVNKNIPQMKYYREVNKCLYMVARSFFLLLLNCSA